MPAARPAGSARAARLCGPLPGRAGCWSPRWLLFLAGIGFDFAVDQQEVWLALCGAAGKGSAAGDIGSVAHVGWLGFAAKLAYLGAAAALAVNILRGVLFLGPLFRGVGLLKSDVVNRRQTLDQLYAHQTRRVDGLEADVDLAARAAAEAEQRAGNAVRGAVRRERRRSRRVVRNRRPSVSSLRSRHSSGRRRSLPARQAARFRCRSEFSSRWTMSMRSHRPRPAPSSRPRTGLRP